MAEEGGLFVAEFQDAPDERCVVILAVAADLAGRFPDLAADGVVVQVLHDGKHRGKLQGEAPGRSFVALGACVCGGSGLGGLGQAGEFRLVGDDEFPGVGRIEHVLGVLFGELGKLGLDGGDALFLIRRQVGAGLAEIGERFLDEALSNRIKFCGFRTLAEGLDYGP